MRKFTDIKQFPSLQNEAEFCEYKQLNANYYNNKSKMNNSMSSYETSSLYSYRDARSISPSLDSTYTLGSDTEQLKQSNNFLILDKLNQKQQLKLKLKQEKIDFLNKKREQEKLQKQLQITTQSANYNKIGTVCTSYNNYNKPAVYASNYDSFNNNRVLNGVAKPNFLNQQTTALNLPRFQVKYHLQPHLQRFEQKLIIPNVNAMPKTTLVALVPELKHQAVNVRFEMKFFIRINT